jgi:hypothetical protein
MSTTPEPTVETLRLVYSEVCKGYYNVREIQLKLLAFIPAISGIAASLVIGKQIDTTHLPIVGILGVVFTIGVFTYGIRADQHAQSLIRHGRSLEQALKLDEGQFKNRPKPYGRVLGYTTALSLIYAGLLLAWGYIILIGLKQ